MKVKKFSADQRSFLKIKARVLINQHGLQGALELAEKEAWKSLEANLEQRQWGFILNYISKVG